MKQYARSTSSPSSSTSSTSTNDTMVNSLMHDLHTFKLSGCRSNSGDSGFLSSGDSSVNGDACPGKLTTSNNTSSTWGNKTIWGAPLSPVSNCTSNSCNNSSINNKDSIWSSTCTQGIQSPPLSGNTSLWENKLNNTTNTNNTNANQEWLGSIWMIPQTPQINNLSTNNNNNNKLSSYSSKLNAIWDTPDSYQTFKNELVSNNTADFQLLRPHDIGRNMWNNSTAAAIMNTTTTNKEPVSSIWATPTYNSNVTNQKPISNATSNNSAIPQNVQKALRINALAYGASGYSNPIADPIAAPMTPGIPSTPIPAPIVNNCEQLNTIEQNTCLQLLSDDFLNYLNLNLN